jgi:tetratricopeptide (TPR) repeat protein
MSKICLRRMQTVLLAALCGAAAPGGGCQSGSRSAQRPSEPPLAQQKFDLVAEPAINPDTRLAAGQLAESRNDWAMAIKQYEAAMKDRPHDARVMHRLGVAYTVTRQYAKAESVWLRYVQATDKSADAYNNLAQCYEYAGRPQEAEHAYMAAVAADPSSVFARTNFGLMLARQDRLDEARAQMSSVLPPAEVHYNIASVMELKGQKTLARGEYLKALELDPMMSDARKRLAALD